MKLKIEKTTKTKEREGQERRYVGEQNEGGVFNKWINTFRGDFN